MTLFTLLPILWRSLLQKKLQATHNQRILVIRSQGSVPTTTAVMSPKYAVALLLALQVSMCLCEVAAPDKELVDKYEAMKTVFYKRLLTAYGKVQGALGPLVENTGSEHGKVVKDYIEDLQTKPHFQSAVKVLTGVAGEAAPLVDKARTGALGLYGQYLRPHIGNHLDEAINAIKVYLDKYLPAE